MGEVAMLNHEDPLKNKRLFTCVVKSDISILLGLDVNVFNILVREKQKKQIEQLGMFLYQTLPAVTINFTLKKITQHASYIFQ